MFKAISFSSNSFHVKAIIKLLFSILFVYCNKFIFIEYGFPNLTLTSLQLATTFFFVLAAQRFGLVTRKKLTNKDLAVSSLLLAGFAAFANLSIDYNALVVSQIIKFNQIPIVLILLTVLSKKSFSLKVKLSTVCI